jgi:hypothetical protein
MVKLENQSPATKFIGAICLEAFATPFFEEGTKALFERAYARTAIAYSIDAVPAVAGLLTVANLQADIRLYRLLKRAPKTSSTKPPGRLVDTQPRTSHLLCCPGDIVNKDRTRRSTSRLRKPPHMNKGSSHGLLRTWR